MAEQKRKQQPRTDGLTRDDERRHADLLDEYGFFTEPDLWNRDLALALAADMHLDELSEAHWRVIDQVRAQYLESGMLPVQSTVCREVELDSDCILALFGGPIKVWRLAGLPDPGEEARTYMENQQVSDAQRTIRPPH